MKVLNIVVSLFLLSLASCGSGDSNSRIPGDKRPPLNGQNQQELQALLGSIGDVAHYLDSLKSSSLSDFDEQETQRIFSRQAFRNELRQSIPQRRCKVRSNGNNGNFQVSIRGNGCPMQASFNQTREEELGQSGVRERKIEFSKNFSTRNRRIATDVAELSVIGSLSVRVTRTNGETRRQRVLTATIRGTSHSLGRFDYQIEESVVASRGSQSRRERIYARQDTINLGDFSAVIYREADISGNASRFVGNFINGEEISDSEYYDLLQDIENQVGLARYGNRTRREEQNQRF